MRNSSLRTFGFLVLPGLLLYSAALPQGVARKPAKPGQDAYAHEIAPLIRQFCGGCHSGSSPAGGIALTAFRDTASIRKARAVWEKVASNVQSAHMPPSSAPQPTQAQRERLVAWIESTLAANAPAMRHVTLRRLNRAEYNNTIRDLLGVEIRPADDFPSDDVGNGFDNIGDVLSLSPLLMEKYLTAAEKVAEAAIVTPEALARAPRKPESFPASHRRIVFCQPKNAAERDACTRKILAAFARKAYRRPVTQAEVERLVRCAQVAKREGESFERGIQLGIEAALVSPNFLFRSELDANGKPGKSRPLDNYALASRLSYFLWSSMPDEELFALAQKGVLSRPEVLAAQARRMLKDPKAHALTENFAGQWLQLRNLSNVAPDPKQFPEFNANLRAAMREETERFFQAIVQEDRSLLDFIDGRFTFLNEPLARLYGIPGITGNEFRRVALTGDARGGLLAQASILTVTSNPTRTSPVKRGKWVLEQLFGTPPPPPPPNVPKLADDKNDKKEPLTGTLRQRMEQHRKDPMCASCHARMDPIGFGLENYNAIGAWRTTDGNLPVDASGTLPGGQSFHGPAQLKAILKAQKTQFVRCLSEKMLTYALGRGLDFSDKRTVENIVNRVARQDYRFSALITAIVQSDPFRLHK